MRFSSIALAAAVAVASLTPPAGALAAEGGTQVTKGREIVTGKCGRCHAVGAEGESTHAKAPPFRDVVKRYPVENLAEARSFGPDAQAARTLDRQTARFRAARASAYPNTSTTSASACAHSSASAYPCAACTSARAG